MKSLLTKTALAGALAGLSFFLGMSFNDVANGASPSSLGQAMMPEDIDLYPVWKAWYLLENRFVPGTTTDALTDEKKMWSMIEGLARAYNDPYTTFMPPAENAIFAEEISGKFSGVGMEIGIENDVLTVIAPLKNTPAEKAGILSGDAIISIDGESTREMSVDQAIIRIRGEEGTTVTLLISRKDAVEPITIKIERATITVPTITSSLRDDGIYVIALYNFGAGATEEFRTALREMRNADAKKLIIDLRGNPGGYLDAAVDIASWFLPAGKVVVREDFGPNGKPTIYRSKGYTGIMSDELSIAVLVNRGSASASEILAGALKEHGVATIIGERTFGKGSVQELIPVTDDTSLKITIARWLTPDGHSISEGGLAPNIEVEITADDIAAKRDPQLERAVEELLD